MEGRGRCLDDVLIERFWRSLKYEDIYLRDYVDGRALTRGIGCWLTHYNECRLHRAHDDSAPAEM